MIIQHNLMTMNTNRQIAINNKKRAISMEGLSSGYRINRAADDAAGLSLSEKMRGQIRGLEQASNNIQDYDSKSILFFTKEVPSLLLFVSEGWDLILYPFKPLYDIFY